MELTQQLVTQLGVQEDQAKGGAGLLFQLAKDRLGAGEFDQVAASIPGMDDLLSAAPQSSGISGMFGGLPSALGSQVGGLGDLASLAGGFSKLGLNCGMIGQFISVVLSFVQGQGGDQLKGLIVRVLSPSE
jgi:hypothetical protein